MKYLKSLSQFLRPFENLILAFLAVIIIISGAMWYNSYSRSHSGQPSAGGTYTEAYVSSTNDWSEPVTELTKVGLFDFDKDGNLHNLLIDSWSVNGDKTEYTFIMKKDISVKDIQDVLQQNLSMVGPASVTYEEPSKLVVQLTQPNSSLPLTLTRPIFDYGPYKIAKSSDREIVFIRSTKQGAVNAYLNKVVIDRYDDTDTAMKMLQKKRVSGATVDSNNSYKGYDDISLQYPRYQFLLFNTNKAPFRDSNIRQKLLSGGDLSGVEFTLTIVDSGSSKDEAKQLMDGWTAKGAKVTLDVKTADDFKNQVAPTRQFQAVIANLNYGPEMDPFYFWDSSQILATGRNLTGVKSDKIDALVAKVDNSLSIKERWDLINQLHTEIEAENIGKLISQEKTNYYVSNDIIHQAPFLPLNESDRFQNFTQWALK